MRLREQLNWFESRPLFGKRIVVTRTRKQAGGLSRRLRALGADVIEIPTIRIEPPTQLREFAELVKDAHTYEWIIFTSPNGVDAFFEWFYRLFQDARAIGGARIAAVGPATAARVREFHLHVDVHARNRRGRSPRRRVAGGRQRGEHQHAPRPPGNDARGHRRRP